MNTSGLRCRVDGGDVEIVDIKGTLVYCSLRGRMLGLRGRQPDSQNDDRTRSERSGG